MDPIMATARKLGVPVLHHAWYKSVADNELESTPADIAKLASRFPDVTIVMAHLGGCRIQGVQDVRKHANVSVDTSGSQPMTGIVEYAVRILGADRVLYGTEAPGRDFASQLGRVFGARISDTARKLDDRLAGEGIGRALVCSPEAVFNPNIDRANEILARRLKGSRRLRPVMTVNPLLESWHEMLPRYRDNGVAAVRLMPMHHCYSLDAAKVAELIEDLAKNGGPVPTVQMRMEDKRTQHPRAVIPGLNVDDLLALARRFPSLPLVALCAYRSEALRLGRESANIHFDLSHVESMRTVTTLLTTVPAERVLFGSHAPFLYARSALMKLQAADVPEEARRAIGSANAERVFGKTS